MSVQLVSFYYKCTFSIGMSKLYHVWTSLCHLMLLQSHLQPLTKIKLVQVNFFIFYLTINALHLSLILKTQWHIILSKKICYMTRLTYEIVDNDYKLVFNNLGVYFILEYVCKAHFALVFAPSFALCPYSNSTNKL